MKWVLIFGKFFKNADFLQIPFHGGFLSFKIRKQEVNIRNGGKY